MNKADCQLQEIVVLMEAKSGELIHSKWIRLKAHNSLMESYNGFL